MLHRINIVAVTGEVRTPARSSVSPLLKPHYSSRSDVCLKRSLLEVVLAMLIIRGRCCYAIEVVPLLSPSSSKAPNILWNHHPTEILQEDYYYEYVNSMFKQLRLVKKFLHLLLG